MPKVGETQAKRRAAGLHPLSARLDLRPSLAHTPPNVWGRATILEALEEVNR